MNRLNLLITGLTLAATFAFGSANAADAMVIEEIGHLGFANEEKAERKVASATTVISRIYRNKAVVEVSQSFVNNTEKTINGEYFFPLPYNSNLLDFELTTDFQTIEELPNTTVQLKERDQLQVSYQYELVDDSPYHASVMGFPAKQNMPLIDTVSQDQLVAKK
ncbi:VIT domain-containing protein [Kangiella sp. HZ709]|uniref:VIT domain-containing protein n=1 Tax=Kangiella sp. HZ709 TaxID=2666328 RepID=UPI0012B15196|nr:VIT domain-containing protein [Kangiella sp. HZ709]MRX27732.1 hypothetical protein [Kangiella sp. HZ709]